jgi:molecular chaperone DnaK
MSKLDKSIIRIGIDLGTTNSAISVNYSGEPEVLKNVLGDQYTPSVVGINKSKNTIVGKKAYEALFKDGDEKNYKAEVKRLMGTNEVIHFERGERSYSPEELSAEILKSLKENAARKYDDLPLLAAVITVPAYFDTLQNEATKRAGNYAGFDYVVLVQEPIAAAVSYGFKSNHDDNWLVYDFGGGTFDVALISAKDGQLRVVEHGGDNHLGGKDIDEKMIDEVLVPQITEQYNLFDFNKGNEKYKNAFCKLKYISEQAKIELSTMDATTIEIDGIGDDENGEEIYISFEYSREELNTLINPILERTIKMVLDVIRRSGLDRSTISKLIFVGGPTQIPYFRERIQEATGIAVDTSSDPLTAVSRGAAIYGMSQNIPSEVLKENHNPVSAEEIPVKFNFTATTTEDAQLVTGTIELQNSEDYYLKISSDSGYYHSANIKIKNGKFLDTVALEKGKTNTFWAHLIDGKGNSIPIFPESFSITHGMAIQGAPIPHPIGVVYSVKDIATGGWKEICDRFFDRSSIPPLSETKTYKTAWTLVKGQSNELPIYIYEGDSENPVNNSIITTLRIKGEDIPFNLPEGTDVDITVSINESRETDATIYIPDIDKELNVRVDVYAREIDEDALINDIDELRPRITDVEKNVRLSDARSQLNGNADTDTKQKVEREIKAIREEVEQDELKNAFGDIEAQYNENVVLLMESARSISDPSLSMEISSKLDAIKSDAERAIAGKDAPLLKKLSDDVLQLMMKIELSNPAIWVAMLNDLRALPLNQFTDPEMANYHIEQARKAITQNDLQGLQRNVASLIQLLPREQQSNFELGAGAGITR